MDLQAALSAAQQYNTSLQKPQSNSGGGSGDNLTGALSDAQKFNALLKSGSPSDVGQYTRNSGVNALQQSGDVPTVKDAAAMYQKGAEASIDVQKAQAIEEQKRSLTTDDEQKAFGVAAKGWDMIQQLSNSWDAAKANTNGFGAGRVQGMLGAAQRTIGANWGANSPDYESWQTVTHMSRPILNAAILGEGKAQSGEKSNIQGFEANLPEDSDTPAVKESKLNAIRLMSWNSLQSTLTGMDAGGRGTAASTFRSSDTYQQMATWANGYTKQLQQNATPYSFGPTSNGLSPELDSKLSGSIGLKPAQQPTPNNPGTPGATPRAPSPAEAQGIRSFFQATPNTNPPGGVQANQGPASVSQPPSQNGSIDWAKFFSTGGGMG
jgi:hypothetical protein